MAATATGVDENASRKYLAESLKRFCRSVELCDDYLRGYYGLKIVSRHPETEALEKAVVLNAFQVTSKALKEPSLISKPIDQESFAFPSRGTLEKLDEKATEKLSEIVRRNGAKEKGWCGYEESEVAAARDLLSKALGNVVK